MWSLLVLLKLLNNKILNSSFYYFNNFKMNLKWIIIYKNWILIMYNIFFIFYINKLKIYVIKGILNWIKIIQS